MGGKVMAQLLGVSCRTVRRWAKMGLMPSKREGSGPRVFGRASLLCGLILKEHTRERRTRAEMQRVMWVLGSLLADGLDSEFVMLDYNARDMLCFHWEVGGYERAIHAFASERRVRERFGRAPWLGGMRNGFWVDLKALRAHAASLLGEEAVAEKDMPLMPVMG